MSETAHLVRAHTLCEQFVFNMRMFRRRRSMPTGSSGDTEATHPICRMQGFSAGTHHAFPRLQWQPSGHPMPEVNERQFGLPFICAGWFTGTIRNGRLAKSRAADCCSILQSAARAKTGFQTLPIACVCLGIPGTIPFNHTYSQIG